MMETETVEAAIIARLLLDPSELPSVELLGPDDFSSEAWGKAFGAIRQLDADGKPIDLIHLRAAGVDVDVLDLPPYASSPLGEYAKLLRDGSLRRRVIAVARTVIERAQDPDTDPIGALETALTSITEIQEADLFGRIDLRDHQAEPPPLVGGFISPDGTTVLYGEGGQGKGWIVSKWIAELHAKVAILDFESHPTEWGHRLAKFGVSLDDDVLYFSPDIPLDKWAERRGAAAIRGAEYIIVDSAAYISSADDPYSPGGVMAFKRARRMLGNLPTILLAHTAKGSTGIYGSVFWRNESRLAWHLKTVGMDRVRVIECTKANAYPGMDGSSFVIDFKAEENRLDFHRQGESWTPPKAAVEEEVLEW